MILMVQPLPIIASVSAPAAPPASLEQPVPCIPAAVQAAEAAGPMIASIVPASSRNALADPLVPGDRGDSRDLLCLPDNKY